MPANADSVGQVTLDVEILEGWLDALLGLDQDDPDIRYVVADLRALLLPTAFFQVNDHLI